ncbi:MAG: glycoside hydrolase family 127 protein [Victivallales bacterium]|nr:glycoside hydrolase family 127 protein [Victivallales bacterium]
MKDYAKLKSLPLGAIKAEGWLREQLERSRDGMGGHLGDLEPQMVWDPYTTKKTDDKWGGVKTGWGAEISGNYWFGFITLAFTLGDEGLIKRADEWVEVVLKNVEEDGYLGAYKPEDDRTEDYNAWGTACGMKALLAYWDATGRRDVFDAVYHCMLWFCKNWAGDKKTRYAGAYIVDPMMTCYYETGDERLLNFCLEYEDFLDRNDLFSNSTRAYLAPKLQYNSNHTAAYVGQLRRPAMIYKATGDDRMLQASVNGSAKLHESAMHSTGAPVANNEYLSPVSLYAETEYCDIAFLTTTYGILGMVTGDTLYGDYLEEMIFNAAEGARKKDEKAIQYNSTPNQIYISDNSSHFNPVHHLFAPIHPVSCCAVTSVGTIPEFVHFAVMTDAEGDLHINSYGPYSIRHHGVVIESQTLYPFRNTIRYVIHADKPQAFGIFCKKPYWCKNWSVSVNGVEGAELKRTWSDGDTIDVTLEMVPRVSRVHDLSKNYPLTLQWGALTFSLPIPERWNNLGNGHARTPLPEGWAWYGVSPVINEKPTPMFENMGYRKEFISWNVALDEKNVTMTMEETEPDGYVWEKPPVKMRVNAYKAPFAYAPYPTKTSEVYEAELDVTYPLDIELVPYGCTALRITYFPRAKME